MVPVSSGMEANLVPCHDIFEVEWFGPRCWETKLRYERPVDMILFDLPGLCNDV